MIAISRLKRFLSQLFTRQEKAGLAFVLGVSFLGLFLQALPRKPGFQTSFVRLTVGVNRATAEELVSLPGIGPTLARRIVEERTRGGQFVTLSDLSRVKGITPKTLARIKGPVRFD